MFTTTSQLPSESTPDTLVTTYLHMTEHTAFSPSFIDVYGVEVVQVAKISVEDYLKLYLGVGDQLRWRDRVVMHREQLQKIIDSPNTIINVLYVHGREAGYVELEVQGDEVEVAYFGLFEEFHGKGYGKHLLSFGIQKAWNLGARRVWVHTCNLDGEFALANYMKRGFEVYKEFSEPMPDRYRQ